MKLESQIKTGLIWSWKESLEPGIIFLDFREFSSLLHKALYNMHIMTN